jgi:hypothetical protein
MNITLEGKCVLVTGGNSGVSEPGRRPQHTAEGV